MPAQGSRQSLHYEGWLVLRTPLQHGGDQSFGNVRLMRSQKLICDDGVVRRCPIYSGNAVRGMLRDIAAGQLMQALDVQLPPHVFDFLTSGGTLTSSGQTTVDLGLARRLRDTIPLVGLFGGGTGNQIIEGKTIFLQGTPICRETLHVLPRYCEGAPSAKLSVRDLRQLEFGTRRDDKKKEQNQARLAGPVPLRQADDVATAMIYETETLAPGTAIRFGFIGRELTEAEARALMLAILGFLGHPFLGARSSAGYGEVSLPWLCRARRRVEMLQSTEGIIDLQQPLATVESEVDPEDQLRFAAADIETGYVADVRARRGDILAALRGVM